MSESSKGNTASTIVAIVPPDDILDVFEPLFSKQVSERTPHITIAYVGQTTVKEFGQIVTTLADTVEEHFRPLRLGFEGAGCFDSGDQRVKFALVNGEDLDKWAYHAKQALIEIGVHVARQAIIPHLTLSYTDELQDNWEEPLLETCGMSWICTQVVVLRGSNKVRFNVPAPDPLTGRNTNS